MDERVTTSQRVRFERVTPANEHAAVLNIDLASLVAPLKLPIYDGYDSLDDLKFAFLTLPSGETFMLGAYLNSSDPGSNLYLDKEAQWHNGAQLVFEACQYLTLARSNITWIHPDFQAEIDELSANNPPNFQERTSSQLEELFQPDVFEPIDCFNHALSIYDREKSPQYWAMLQRNLGLAYYHRIEGDRVENLSHSILCFSHALSIHTATDFPDLQQLDYVDLTKAAESIAWYLIEDRLNLDNETIDPPMTYRHLSGVNFSGANLNGTNLSGARLDRANLSDTSLKVANLSSANLSGSNLNDARLYRADLSGADLSTAELIDANLSGTNLTNSNLSGANLSSADLSSADLINANLSGANLTGADMRLADLRDADVNNARFGANQGIDESIKQDLIARGAIFDDLSIDRSESMTLIPR
jgi:uncharacterized protein YjbI with pentapeptide repeats